MNPLGVDKQHKMQGLGNWCPWVWCFVLDLYDFTYQQCGGEHWMSAGIVLDSICFSLQFILPYHNIPHLSLCQWRPNPLFFPQPQALRLRCTYLVCSSDTLSRRWSDSFSWTVVTSFQYLGVVLENHHPVLSCCFWFSLRTILHVSLKTLSTGSLWHVVTWCTPLLVPGLLAVCPTSILMHQIHPQSPPLRLFGLHIYLLLCCPLPVRHFLFEAHPFCKKRPTLRGTQFRGTSVYWSWWVLLSLWRSTLRKKPWWCHKTHLHMALKCGQYLDIWIRNNAC